MNCVKGDLARILKPTSGAPCGLVDLFVSVVGPTSPVNGEHTHSDGSRSKTGGAQWEIKFSHPQPLMADGERVFVTSYVMWDHRLRPIRDNPGNESFVTEARKSIPRPIPVTGPVTIDSRGEPA